MIDFKNKNALSVLTQLTDFRNQKLFETSLSRIWKHVSTKSIGMISAFKPRLPMDKNLNRHGELRNLIRQSGNYNYISLVGYWEDDKGIKKKEYSFFIFSDAEHEEELKLDLLKWGELFNQEAIVFKPHDNKEAYLYGTSDINKDTGKPFNMKRGDNFSVGTFTTTKLDDIFSQTKGGKRFAFAEMQTEKGFMETWVSKIMESKKIIKEFFDPSGFWIKGNEILDLDGRKHIDFLFKSPEAFGLTREEINAEYEKYNEKLGQEGRARENLIKKVSKNGWVRVRQYPRYWTIQADYFMRRKKTIENFLLWAITEELMHPDDELIILGYEDDFKKHYSFAQGGAKSFFEEFKIKEVYEFNIKKRIRVSEIRQKFKI